MATVEHAALVVLVSLALAAGGAVLDGARLASAVVAQIRVALCLVAGGDCFGRDGPAPCVVGSEERSRLAAGTLAVVRLRDGRSVLLERRSDGSVRVTVGLVSDVGAGVLFGGRMLVGGRGLGAGGTVDAAIGPVSERRFVVADLAAARRLVSRLDREDPPVGGSAVGLVRFLTGAPGEEDERAVAFRGAAEAEASLEHLGLGSLARFGARTTAGVRVHRASGERTLLLRLDRSAGASLSAPFSGLGLGLDAGMAVELTLDRQGRPATLVVRASGAVRGDAQLPGIDANGGDRAEAAARLDLADPAARALARRLVGGDAAAASALGAHLRRSARIDVRRYATTHDERTRGLEAGVLGRVGATVTTTTDTARLVGAWGREPGLGWAARLDCGLPA